MWYLIVSIPDLCHLSYFALASHGYCSTHCVEVVDVLEKKKLNCKNYHFQKLCFSKVSNVRSISESFGKPRLSLILTNQGLTIMVRGRTVINISLYDDIAHVWIQRGIGGPDIPPLENNKYVYVFL